nr:alpha/beta hydrolase [Salipaludibacillus aurantiacus]
MEGSHLKINGKEIYTEQFGTENDHAILYLHGGPGESCFDFAQHQGQRLGRDFHVVMLDQRGVCRSEVIQDNEPFGLMDIVADWEEIRQALRISKWSVIGHSFGGYLALLYSWHYPNAVNKVIFEGPTFDFAVTSRALLTKTATLALKYGKEELAQQCLVLRDSQAEPIKLTEGYMALSHGLEDSRMEIYRYNSENPTDTSKYSEAEWEHFYDRSEIHYNRLRREGRIFEPLFDKLSGISVPMLMINGLHDPVACDVHRHFFLQKAEKGRIITFTSSGHTPHYEEPDRFAEEVRKFLLEK